MSSPLFSLFLDQDIFSYDTRIPRTCMVSVASSYGLKFQVEGGVVHGEHMIQEPQQLK